jgi:hypothetical protein
MQAADVGLLFRLRLDLVLFDSSPGDSGGDSTFGSAAGSRSAMFFLSSMGSAMLGSGKWRFTNR